MFCMNNKLKNGKQRGIYFIIKQNLDFKINQQNSSYNQTLPPNYQGGTADGKEQIDFTNFLQHANHPCICFFTIIFKLAAILT